MSDMHTKKLNENEYEIFIYDWIELSDDYLCGHARRQPDAEEESDLRYWMFYPIGEAKPLMVGDLRRLFSFISDLNTQGN